MKAPNVRDDEGTWRLAEVRSFSGVQYVLCGLGTDYLETASGL